MNKLGVVWLVQGWWYLFFTGRHFQCTVCVLLFFTDGYNDVNYRWIAYSNWTYSLKFKLVRELLQQRPSQNMDPMFLKFDGLDTVANIRYTPSSKFPFPLSLLLNSMQCHKFSLSPLSLLDLSLPVSMEKCLATPTATTEDGSSTLL